MVCLMGMYSCICYRVAKLQGLVEFVALIGSVSYEFLCSQLCGCPFVLIIWLLDCPHSFDIPFPKILVVSIVYYIQLQFFASQH